MYINVNMVDTRPVTSCMRMSVAEIFKWKGKPRDDNHDSGGDGGGSGQAGRQ
jgi:hypothetical protein